MTRRKEDVYKHSDVRGRRRGKNGSDSAPCHSYYTSQLLRLSVQSLGGTVGLTAAPLFDPAGNI